MMTLSQEAECNVIGGLLLYGDDCAEALDALSPDDFTEESYGQIFRVVKTLYLQDRPIDCPRSSRRAEALTTRRSPL